ncbi:flagellar biosynthesis anti-sigma factor FlgM [Litchfieldia alkalitelluris]|uniref:flagellar biosynthesis anti-sigma factor FlgM n=1 Tax=Litchfieldia alkalitelluris TaxID=304268 RepID=UPI000997A1B9|nr:flagellar biosynthesis anti-sigma factor FlgM [Litchfieldia alkalitelluris]
MKINQTNLTGINPYKKQMNKMAPLEKKAQQDRLEISNEAKQLQEKSPITQEREEKVEALKHQVQSGTYTVDAKKVAKSVLDYYNQS